MDLGYRSLRRTTNVSDGSNAKDPLRAKFSAMHPINRHFQSRSALGKSAKERCPQNRYRDLNPHSPKDALSSGAAFEIQIIAISSLPWIGESRPIPLGNAGAPFSGA